MTSCTFVFGLNSSIRYISTRISNHTKQKERAREKRRNDKQRCMGNLFRRVYIESFKGVCLSSEYLQMQL